MANFCLPKFDAEKFLGAIKKGEITPEKLAGFESSAARREFLSKYVGEEHAKDVNALIESKMLLKDFKTGLVTAVKKITGLKPEVKRDIFTKIEKMDRLLDVDEESAFLQDIASKKLGTEVTFENAQEITKLSQEVQKAKEAPMASPEEYLFNKETAEQKANRLNYGEQLRILAKYVDDLNPTVNKNIGSNIANIPRTAQSSLDFSAVLRQGWGMMSRGEFYRALPKMFRYAFSEKAYHELQADILSRPTFEKMKSGGLRISVVADKLSQHEEQFMSTLLNKVPGVRGSERAYVGFLNKLRADVFDNLLKKSMLAEEDVSVGSPVLKDLANVVNDFTGSGNIGKGDKYANAVPILNATLFSPRKLSATINMFNPERYLNPNISKTARLAATRQLIGSLAISVGVLGLAKMLGGKVETDPKSADFGKAVFGKTHYGVTGGNSSYAVLLAHIISNKTKSSTTGKVTSLDAGYKPPGRGGTIQKFGRNKLSPIASLITDWLVNENSGKLGEKFNLVKGVTNRITPIIANDIATLIKEDPGNTILGTLLDIFGSDIQTY